MTNTPHDFVPGESIGGAPPTDLCAVCGLVQNVPDHRNRTEAPDRSGPAGSEGRDEPES